MLENPAYHAEMDRYDREEAHAVQSSDELDAVDDIEAGIKKAATDLFNLASKHKAYWDRYVKIKNSENVASYKVFRELHTQDCIEELIRENVFASVLSDLKNTIKDDDRP